jgi:hypothetical protein
MKDYLKYFIDLITKKKEEEVELDDRPSIQLEIPIDYITNIEEKQEEDKEKSSVIVIDI